MRKIALLTIALSLSACRFAGVEDSPDVWQCQFNGNPRAFYCKHTGNGKRVKVPLESPDMVGAQCLMADEFKAMQSYVDYLIGEARRRCK
jgi:hypothetical protein